MRLTLPFLSSICSSSPLSTIANIITSTLKSSPFFQLIINHFVMSHVTISNSHFGHYATDHNFTSNTSLVKQHLHPIPVGSNLPKGQLHSLDYSLAHVDPNC